MSMQYQIFNGWNHRQNKPIYRVDGVDNEYCGEWTSDKQVAEQEMLTLQPKQSAAKIGTNETQLNLGDL